jgi:endoglucanase
VWKEKLLPYMQSVVNAIRAYDADGIDNIIICGTDNWSQFVDAPVENPVRDRNGQIMYTMHFYAGTHDAAYEDDPDYDEEKGAWLKTKVLNALAGGLAVFCTEWGTSLATGDGGPFIDFAERWLNFLDENKISWASWSLARKAEVSSSTLPATSAQPTDTDGDGIRNWDWNSELSTTGRFVRAKIRGEATPIYEDFALVQGFEGGNLGNLALNSDSPNTALTITAADINGNGVVALAGINGNGVWDNRLQFSSQNFLYGIYQNLMVDVYLPNTAADTALFTLKPVFQYAKNGDPDAMNWWADAIPDTVLTGKDFAPVSGTALMKATALIPIKALEPAAKDTLEHLILMVSLSADSADSLVYLDRLGFGSRHNGDARYLPMLPDEPGAFVKLPYDFESGQRESWAKEGVSAVDYRDIRIAVAETKAFAFPVSFDTTNNEWEDGARFSSGHLSESQLSADESREIKGIALDVYLEAGVMTQGNLLLNICPIPNGDGYWYAAGAVPLSPEEGEAVQSPDGVELVKYHVELPLAADGSYPFTVAIRNLVLALQSQGSDYRGMVYYDNIAFTK